jgi:hypothetical protein
MSRSIGWAGRGALVAVGLLVISATALSADTPVGRFDGRPEFSKGEALGYFVWREGDTWKVRWTTFGAEHRFSGRVAVEGGELTSLKRIDVDTERRVIRPGRPAHVVHGPRGRARYVAGGRPAVVASRVEDHIERETEHLIRFNTQTDDDVDGFDFKVTGTTRMLRFVLEIDGVQRPAEIEVGRANFKPQDAPLVARLR